MKKLLICLLMFILVLTGCSKNNEVVKPSEVVYWGINDGILYLSPTPQGYAVNENTSLLNSVDWNDIPWFEYDGQRSYIGGNGVYGVEILMDEDIKITPLSTAFWFESCNCEYIHGLQNLDTSLTTNMRSMFAATSVKELNVSSLNTSNVIDMNGMFACLDIISLDLSNFDTSNVTDMRRMFEACDELTNLNLSMFNTSNVTDMSNMFDNSWNLSSVDVSSFDTSNVEHFSGMFKNTGLTKENTDLSNFDISKAVDISSTDDLFGFHM